MGSPMAGVEAPKEWGQGEDDDGAEVMTAEQVAKFLAAAEGNQFETLFKIAFHANGACQNHDYPGRLRAPPAGQQAGVSEKIERLLNGKNDGFTRGGNLLARNDSRVIRTYY